MRGSVVPGHAPEQSLAPSARGELPPAAQWVLAHTPARIRRAAELAIRTAVDAGRDRILGLAAEIAFWLLLSLPPLLLVIVGSAGFVGDAFGADVATRLREQLLVGALTVFNAETVNGLIRPIIDTAVTSGRADVASLGFVVLIWSASRAVNIVVGAVTIAYDLEHVGRTAWQRRLLAFGLTIVAVTGGLIVIPMLLLGPELAVGLLEPLSIGEAMIRAGRVLYWPVVAVFATLVLATLYHYGVPWWTPWRRDVPGALLAMVVWLMGSMALRSYVALAITGSALYGQLAAPLFLLLWLYVIGLAVLLGAELNAEIERLWPTEHTPWSVRRTRRLVRSSRRVLDRSSG